MAIGNAPTWKTSQALTVYNGTGSSLGANLFLVADASYDNGAKVPATSAVVQAVKGVSNAAIATTTWGSVFSSPGDVVVVKASGTVAKGDNLFLDVAAGKEGRVKTYVNFATNASQFIVGVADSGGADGELVSVVLGGGYRNTAA